MERARRRRSARWRRCWLAGYVHVLQYQYCCTFPPDRCYPAGSWLAWNAPLIHSAIHVDLVWALSGAACFIDTAMSDDVSGFLTDVRSARWVEGCLDDTEALLDLLTLFGVSGLGLSLTGSGSTTVLDDLLDLLDLRTGVWFSALVWSVVVMSGDSSLLLPPPLPQTFTFTCPPRHQGTWLLEAGSLSLSCHWRDA